MDGSGSMNCNNISFASSSSAGNNRVASHTGRPLTPFPDAYVSEPMMTYSRDSEADWADTDSDDSSSCYSQSPSDSGSVYQPPPQSPPQTRYADGDRSFVSPFNVLLIRGHLANHLDVMRATQWETNPIVLYRGGSPASSGFSTPAVTADNSSSGSTTPTPTTGTRVFTGSAGSVPRVLRVVNGPISPLSPAPTLRVVNNPSAPLSPPGPHDISTVFGATSSLSPPRTLRVVNPCQAVEDDGLDVDWISGKQTRFDSLLFDRLDDSAQDTSELFALSTPSPDCDDYGGFFDINAYHGHGNATSPDNCIDPYGLQPGASNVCNVPVESEDHTLARYTLDNSGWNCLTDFPVSYSPRQSASDIRAALMRISGYYRDSKVVGQVLFYDKLTAVKELSCFTPFSYTNSFQPRSKAMKEMEGDVSPKSRG
jgi:hypothetical protein